MPQIGLSPLSASRRLAVALRNERSEGQVIGLRLQLADGEGWHSTSMRISFPTDQLPELLAVLERAIERSPSL